MLDSDNLIDEILNQKFKIKIATSGYAACGKTTIANKIQKKLGADIIPAEIWFYDNQNNKYPHLSGAHPDRYDLKKSTIEISQLIAGGKIKKGEYSHEKRLFENFADFQIGDNYVLDGTIFSLKIFRNFVDKVYFFEPENINTWVAFASHRDVSERNFDLKSAIKKNEAKLRDMQLILDNSACDIIKIKVNHQNNILKYNYSF